MSARVTIYGKAACPFTSRAREAYAARGYEVDFVDVKSEPARLDEMLDLSGGRRRVPVIVEKGRVTVGHRGS
jgi:glutaredoxin 3